MGSAVPVRASRSRPSGTGRSSDLMMLMDEVNQDRHGIFFCYQPTRSIAWPDSARSLAKSQFGTDLDTIMSVGGDFMAKSEVTLRKPGGSQAISLSAKDALARVKKALTQIGYGEVAINAENGKPI
jgi:hypothetical protein